MSLTLDPMLEQRIQRQLERGAYREPSELIAHALDLVEAEEDWLLQNREAINVALEQSFAQAARGKSYSGDEARRVLAERRAARTA